MLTSAKKTPLGQENKLMIDRDDDGNLLPDIILVDRYKIIKLIHIGPVSRIYRGFDCKIKKIFL